MEQPQTAAGPTPPLHAVVPGRIKKAGARLRKTAGMMGLTVVSWAGPKLARIGFIRKPLSRSLEKHIRESSINYAKAGYKPARVVQDRMHMGLAILNTIESAIARNQLSATSIRKLLKNLAVDALMHQGEPTAKQRFVRENGVRPPEILLISPTKACNLRCKGCYADSTAVQEKLKWPVFDRLVTEAHDLWGSRFIVLSGGEPLIYRDQGHGVLDLAEKHPDTYFMMYTNATLIDVPTARRMGELGNIMPAVSIEGLRERTDTRRGEGVFDKVLAALERLRREKVFFGLSITATKENAEEILSDEVIDFYFKEQGALFAWVFHYMPIGRAITLDLMPSPEQRLWLWKRSWELIRDRKLFVADFWNGGTTSQGCISAGRSGGYMAVCWNGDVIPCVFAPYSPVNANTAYAEGKTLHDMWAHPFFAEMRKWQRNYGYAKKYVDNPEIHNWMLPCPARDHYRDFHPMLKKYGVKPLDENAEAAMLDPEYYNRLVAYNDAVANLLDPIWDGEYMDPDFEIPS